MDQVNPHPVQSAMINFSYHTPATLDEAQHLLAGDPARNRLLAGGTDLYLVLEHWAETAGQVIDLKRIPGLDGVEATPEGGWRIGALTRMADVERDGPLRGSLPALCEAAAVVGGPPVRNRATLGGNLCNASPAADTAPPLLAMDAAVEISGPGGLRTVPLAQLWDGPRSTTLAPGEILTAVTIPPPGPRAGNAFARVTRSAMDIAVVNAAAVVALDGQGLLTSLRIALGAVGPMVVAVPGLEELIGKPVDAALAKDVERRAEAAAQPISDVRASAAYRREMAGVLAGRAVREAAQRAAPGIGKGGRP